MRYVKKRELEQIKEYFVYKKWTDGFFQLLFLIDDVKPGMYLQMDNKKRDLEQLRNMLSWLDLYVSTKHGGFATKNKGLYKKWNKIIGFKFDAKEFLGYPDCCVEARNLHIPTKAIGLYSLIKQVRSQNRKPEDIRKFILLHHTPCSYDCRKSALLEAKYEMVLKKYSWLVKDLLPAFIKHAVKTLIQLLEFVQDVRQAANDKLKNTAFLAQLKLDLNDIHEIIENKKEFTANIRYGKQLLASFL